MSRAQPWCDLKVAFPLDNPERLWRAFDAKKIELPDGWEMSETDCSGARCVVIFRVTVMPTEADGRSVKAQVRRWGR